MISLKKLLLTTCALSIALVHNVHADLIGGVLNLARDTVDAAANVTEGAINVVDDGTAPIRRKHVHIVTDAPIEGTNLIIEDDALEEPQRITIEKTITTYEK